jgi:hypothetical protein
MAGPVALPPVDQRVSTARSLLGEEDAAKGCGEAAAMTPARLAHPVNKVAATNRINDM